jgi:FdrA protein
VTSVCGTPGDPQNYEEQIAKLRAAGAIVAGSNAEAAELALEVVRG